MFRVGHLRRATMQGVIGDRVRRSIGGAGNLDDGRGVVDGDEQRRGVRRAAAVGDFERDVVACGGGGGRAEDVNGAGVRDGRSAVAKVPFVSQRKILRIRRVCAGELHGQRAGSEFAVQRGHDGRGLVAGTDVAHLSQR